MSKEDVKQLLDLNDKVQDLLTAWHRQLLTLAAGGLTLLVGLGPDVPTNPMARYCLATALVALGLGISFGAAAIYRDVYCLRTQRDAFARQLRKALEKRMPLPCRPIFGKPGTPYKWCGYLMVGSLLVAVIALVAFSVIVTLDFQPFPHPGQNP